MKLVNPTDDELNAAFAEKMCGFSEPVSWYDWSDRKARSRPRHGYKNAPPRQRNSQWWGQDFGTCIGVDGEKLAFHPYHAPKNFTTSADAVLPWLEKWGSEHGRAITIGLYCDGTGHTVEIAGGPSETGWSIPRIAVIALLRANGVEIE